MLKTEARNPKSTHIDRMSSVEMVHLMCEENAVCVRAVMAASDRIAQAVDRIAEALEGGGRLFFIGAGTSGRLGVLDAAECPPTFGVSPELVQGILAGGDGAMFRASENAEDSEANGRRDIAARVRAGDVVVGISVAGGAAYVVGALKEARARGAGAIALTANPDTPLEKEAELCIVTDTGAEVVTGSTRLKAGTAHKMVLNMLSTCAMIKTGRVYENLMINLKPSNRKLAERVVSIAREITGLDEDAARAALDENGWDIAKTVRGRETGERT